jgi:serine protease Do
MGRRNLADAMAMAAMTVGMAWGAAAPPPLPQGGFADIVERSIPGVVRVVVAAPGVRGKTGGEGSGVVLSADGLLLTNRHVVEGASKISVQFSDDRELPATLAASDGPTDLALLKVDATGLRPIEFGDSARVRIGDYALAIGNPFGVGTTVTLGIVSAKGENDYIQTDAAINPGNSGGPLLNTSGQLIGINTAIVSTSGGSNGVGFAIPSNLARLVAAELKDRGHVDRGYLGAGFQPLTDSLQEALGVARGGALIADVMPGSPAEQAGLQKGDVVVAMNGRVLRDFRRLQLYAAQAKPQSVVELTIARAGTETVIPVKLAKRPGTAAAAPALEEVLPGAALADSGNAGEGPVVAAVDPQGVSAAAGLRPGDVVVSIDRSAVASVTALKERLSKVSGKPVLLEVTRGGATYFLALPRT